MWKKDIEAQKSFFDKLAAALGFDPINDAHRYCAVLIVGLEF